MGGLVPRLHLEVKMFYTNTECEKLFSANICSVTSEVVMCSL